ncbi:MAG: histidinol-phosphate transaminase [Candidimonas sp.]
MSRFWSDDVADLIPYTAGEQPKVDNLLKLNTNEHPYGPSPLALQAIRDAANDTLRLYPDYDSSALRQAVARLHGIDPAQVFVGNGSDEVLAHVFRALFRREGRALWMPDISYSFYRTYVQMFDIPFRLIPLADDFSIRVDDYAADDGAAPAGIIIANPNAPTGIALDLGAIGALAQAHPDAAVVIDEAYVDFGARSAVSLLAKHDNLVVVHTLSKSRALAGLRVGYAMAGKAVVDGLKRVKDSFNSYPLDRPAQAGALASIEDTAYFHEKTQLVIQAREDLARRLREMGFQVLPSSANFIFARHPGHDAQRISQDLRAQGILVRHFKNERIQQFLRISIGTLQDNDRLCNVLKGILDDKH